MSEAVCRVCGLRLKSHTDTELSWCDGRLIAEFLRKCCADLDNAPERERLEQRLRSYIPEKAGDPR